LWALTSSPEAWPLSSRLGAAALVVLVALLLRFGLFKDHSGDVYLTFFPAVAIAIIVGGSAGGVLAVALSVLAIELWVNPYDQLGEWVALAVFTIGAAIIAFALRLVHYALTINLSREFQRRRNAQLKAIVDTALEGMITYDKQGVLQYANPAACEIYGYEGSELVGLNVKSLMPDSESAQQEGVIVTDLDAGEKKIIGRRRRVLGRRKQGEIVPTELTVNEASFGDGEILFVGMMRDLSALEREKARADALRDKLFHASRLNDMSEVVESLAHDVAQPLTAIANFLAAARRMPGAADLRGADGVLVKAENQAKRASDILGRLRGFIEKRSPERAPEDLHRLIEAALGLAYLGDAEKAPQIELREISKAIDVNVDRIQIQQVIINFLRNAAEAAKDALIPKIVVATSIDNPGRICVSVEDNGSGVDPEVAGKLFEPFVSTKTSGMGIGLSLCKSIIESHGGEIGYRPANPRGSVFFFALPILARKGQPRLRGARLRGA
jgi:two-component system, LuxR family, sensor kinase FixL